LCDWSGNMTRKKASISQVDHTTLTESGHFLQDTLVGVSGIERDISSLPYFINSSVSQHSVTDFCLNLYYYFSIATAHFTDTKAQLVVWFDFRKSNTTRSRWTRIR